MVTGTPEQKQLWFETVETKLNKKDIEKLIFYIPKEQFANTTQTEIFLNTLSIIQNIHYLLKKNQMAQNIFLHYLE